MPLLSLAVTWRNRLVTRQREVSQLELDLSDMDDFTLIEERRKVQSALAFLTDKYKALNDEMAKRETLQWMTAP